MICDKIGSLNQANERQFIGGMGRLGGGAMP
jgi:hypothetical protein